MVPDPGPYRGPEGVRRFWDMWRESFEDFRIEIVEVHDLDDHVVVIARVHGTGRDSGAAVDDARLPAGLDLQRGPDRAHGDVPQRGQRQRGDRKGLAVIRSRRRCARRRSVRAGRALGASARDGGRRHRAGHARARLDGAGRAGRRRARDRSTGDRPPRDRPRAHQAPAGRRARGRAPASRRAGRGGRAPSGTPRTLEARPDLEQGDRGTDAPERLRCSRGASPSRPRARSRAGRRPRAG